MGLASLVVLPMAGVWMASEFGIYFATFSARQARKHDRQSLNLMIGGTFAAAMVALFCWFKGWGHVGVGPWLPLVGLGLMGLGLALRWWAILTLRRFFTINVALADDHQLITRGPYRLMRHPSYTGTLTCLLGIGLALENALALVAIVGVPLAALVFRMRVEEAVLRSAFGADYDAYCRATSRLLPGIY